MPQRVPPAKRHCSGPAPSVEDTSDDLASAAHHASASPLEISRQLLSMQDLWYSYDASLGDMFAGLTGKDLYDMVRKVYIVGPPYKIDYLDLVTGDRLALRHPLNQRPRNIRNHPKQLLWNDSPNSIFHCWGVILKIQC